MEIRYVEAEELHADRRDAFPNFANPPKKVPD